MSGTATLVSFTCADHYSDKVFVDPSQVAIVIPLRKDRDLGEYSAIVMHSGHTVEVSGSSDRIAKRINSARAWTGGEG